MRDDDGFNGHIGHCCSCPSRLAQLVERQTVRAEWLFAESFNESETERMGFPVSEGDVGPYVCEYNDLNGFVPLTTAPGLRFFLFSLIYVEVGDVNRGGC